MLISLSLFILQFEIRFVRPEVSWHRSSCLPPTSDQKLTELFPFARERCCCRESLQANYRDLPLSQRAGTDVTGPPSSRLSKICGRLLSSSSSCFVWGAFQSEERQPLGVPSRASWSSLPIRPPPVSSRQSPTARFTRPERRRRRRRRCAPSRPESEAPSSTSTRPCPCWCLWWGSWATRPS